MPTVWQEKMMQTGLMKLARTTSRIKKLRFTKRITNLHDIEPFCF